MEKPILTIQRKPIGHGIMLVVRNGYVMKYHFLNHVFSVSKIDLPGKEYIDTVKESGHIRYKYYGVGLNFTGTIFTELADKTIADNSPFYENMKIDETIEYLETDFAMWIFWIIWMVLIGVCVYSFYYIDNKWLE